MNVPAANPSYRSAESDTILKPDISPAVSSSTGAGVVAAKLIEVVSLLIDISAYCGLLAFDSHSFVCLLKVYSVEFVVLNQNCDSYTFGVLRGACLE